VNKQDTKKGEPENVGRKEGTARQRGVPEGVRDEARTDDPTFNIPLKKGYARALGADGGRTAELKRGERGRGDTGGGEADDGIPAVPHGTGDDFVEK
jgi:hypothetical protein